jgi:glycosyltransferase involved in cell wall biosynthesis
MTAPSKGRLVHVTTVDLSLVKLLLPQLKAFRDAGWEVTTVSAPGPYADELRAEGFHHVELASLTRAWSLRADLAAFIELWRLFRKLRPDVVHTHNPKPGVLGRIAARLAGVPRVVNTVHGLYAQPTDRFPRRAAVYGAERVASAFSDVELVQNPEDVATLRSLRIPADKLVMFGNGVDLARFDPDRWTADGVAARAELGVDEHDTLVLTVGRLVAEKGFGELFVAVPDVLRDAPRTRFVVIGPDEPDKADALPREHIDAATAAGVTLLGHRDDVERWYAAADLFVLPSYREGFPRSAMEASAMGVPVIATDIRGCRQVVDDGETGRLVPVRTVAPLAAAITELASDPELRARMAKAAREKALVEFDDRTQIRLSLAAYAGTSP